jgi:hypothetical protein
VGQLESPSGTELSPCLKVANLQKIFFLRYIYECTNNMMHSAARPDADACCLYRVCIYAVRIVCRLCVCVCLCVRVCTVWGGCVTGGVELFVPRALVLWRPPTAQGAPAPR